ncbi:MAG: AMP-binding protein [Reichenbachiella sp.]|uniref:class I adenylate-forming enzyme family protein n=1 Tax=Reichenbachiella sp. TaxID=2184521 RepID=UPI00326548A4
MYRKDWLSKWAIYSPDKVAITESESGRKITYQNMNNQANFLANKWIEQELQFGDRIMILAEHCIEYVVLFSLAQKTGITLVPINYRLSTQEVDFLIKDAGPKLLVVERKFEHLIKDRPENLKVVWMEDLADTLKSATSSHFTSLEIDEDHPLFILYTSGTTGFPKGAIYSHKMLLWNSINTSQSLEITPTDHTISCMPAFHTGGWNVLLTPLLHRGGSVSLMKKFDPDLLLKQLEATKSQLFMGVPTMLKMMAESEYFDQVNLSNMRYFIVGGEALPLDVIRTWHDKGVKIRQGYGLTEVGPNLTSLHQREAERKMGSIGLPNFYTDLKILTADGREAKNDEIGELCFSGPLVTPGYWQNKKATNEALTDGWFRTGDLAKMDAEGFLYIVDRIKCMFISGGENVYPAEVERVIRLLPQVDEVAVIGVPDEKWGEVGKAFLTTKNNSTIELEELTLHVEKHLAKFKVPRHLEVLTAIPKNESGKIDRKLLKA